MYYTYVKWYNTNVERKYKEKDGIVYCCDYYIVWCVKYKRKLLVDAVVARCEELIRSECNEIGVTLLNLSIYPNHIKIHIDLLPQQNVHRIVKALKRKTSSVLRKEFKELSTKVPTLWDNKYLVSAGVPFSEKTVDNYIDSQETSQRDKEKLKICKLAVNNSATE